MKRQLLRPLVDRLRTLGVSLDAPASVASTPIITKARKASARREFLDFETSQSSFSLATEQGRETYKSERRLIERVVIHNVKAIRDLDLESWSSIRRRSSSRTS